MSTVASPGGRPCSAVNAATSSATRARMRAATALPSMISAAMRRASLHRRMKRRRSGTMGRTMVRRTAAALVFLVTLVAVPGAAQARVVVGMGDQKPAMFTDKRLHSLGVRDARIVVSWNVMASSRERAWAQNWLIEARRANVEPLVAFGHA